MTADSKRKYGFYWVRFKGRLIVAEYFGDGYWHVPSSPDGDIEPWYHNRELGELLSARLRPPTGKRKRSQ